jgi:uncharacterized repeat protein (TIGR02543 family)
MYGGYTGGYADEADDLWNPSGGWLGILVSQKITFDGGGHTIYGLHSDDISAAAGLFQSLNNGTEVHDLTIGMSYEDPFDASVTHYNITAKQYAGALAGKASLGVIITRVNVAGLGQPEISVSRTGLSEPSYACAGGLVGYAGAANDTAEITECTVSGIGLGARESGENYLGGIAGYFGGSSVEITDCTVSDVDMSLYGTSGKEAGGILAHAQQLAYTVTPDPAVKNSVISGNTVINSAIGSDEYQTAGGAVGFLQTKFGGNSVDVDVSDNLALDCVVTSKSGVGGLIGYYVRDTGNGVGQINVTIDSNSVSASRIEAAGSNARIGGLIGAVTEPAAQAGATAITNNAVTAGIKLFDDTIYGGLFIGSDNIHAMTVSGNYAAGEIYTQSGGVKTPIVTATAKIHAFIGSPGANSTYTNNYYDLWAAWGLTDDNADGLTTDQMTGEKRIAGKKIAGAGGLLPGMTLHGTETYPYHANHVARIYASKYAFGMSGINVTAPGNVEADMTGSGQFDRAASFTVPVTSAAFKATPAAGARALLARLDSIAGGADHPAANGDHVVLWGISPAGVVRPVPVEIIINMQEYSVTYYANAPSVDISSEPYEVQTQYTDSQELVLPVDPQVNGLTFLGWSETQYEVGAGADDLIATPYLVTGDIDLYAVWELDASVEFTVEYVINAGDSPDDVYHTQSGARYGDAYVFPADDPEVDEEVFLGWATDEDAEMPDVSETDAIYANRTLWGVWRSDVPGGGGVIYYTVTFKDGYNPGNYAVKTVEAGTALGAEMPPDPSRSGHVFDGWSAWFDRTYTSPFDENTLITSDVVVTAHWTASPPAEYDHEFIDNRANEPLETPKNESVRLSAGDAFGASFPTADPLAGYIFLGWNTNENWDKDADTDGIWITADTIPDAPVTAYAIWLPEDFDPSVWQVIFIDELNGTYLEFAVPDGTEVGDVGYPAQPAADGFDFGGWFETDGTEILTNTVASKNIVAYASWTPVAVSPFTVTFMSNTQIPPEWKVGEVDVADGDAIGALPGVPDAGTVDDEFIEWNTERDGSGVSITAATIVTGNMTVYAVWKSTIGTGVRYTVIYYWNTPDNNDAYMTQADAYEYGDPVLPPQNPAASGLRFLGWSLTQYAADAGAEDVISSEYTVTDDTDLYGVWETKPTPPPTTPPPSTPPPTTPETPKPESGDGHEKYIAGYGDGTIRPDNSITRAEVAMIIWRLAKDPAKFGAFTSVFPDVKAGSWYTQAIGYLTGKGILKGYPDGEFKPDRPISRAEFVTIVTRFMRYGAAPEAFFPDMPAFHEYRTAFNQAIHYGAIFGYPDGTIKPARNLSRAEAMAIINRVLNRKIHVEDVPEDMRQFADVFPDQWHYAEVVEAMTNHIYRRREDDYELWSQWDSDHMHNNGSVVLD